MKKFLTGGKILEVREDHGDEGISLEQVPGEWPLEPWLLMSRAGSCRQLHSTNQQTFLPDPPESAANSLMRNGSQT